MIKNTIITILSILLLIASVSAIYYNTEAHRQESLAYKSAMEAAKQNDLARAAQAEAEAQREAAHMAQMEAMKQREIVEKELANCRRK